MGNDGETYTKAITKREVPHFLAIIKSGESLPQKGYIILCVQFKSKNKKK